MDVTSTLLSLKNTQSNCLLNMLKSDKGTIADSIFAANIQANQEKINSIIEKATNVSLKTDTSKYEKVAKDAANTNQLLMDLQKNDLYSGDVKNVNSTVDKFVTNYNQLLTDMDSLGGNIEKIYGAKFDKLTTANKEVLTEIGITISKDGKLEIDKEKLQKADVNKVKEVFTGIEKLGTNMKTIISDVSEVLTQALRIKYAQSTNYGKSGSYTDPYTNSVLNTKA